MRVKLLLRVAEEMTSLSKLFKALHDGVNKTPAKQIQIRPLQYQPGEEATIDPVEQVIERERQIEAAQLAVETEKQEILSMQTEVMQEIEQLRTAWDEERKNLEQQAYEEGFQLGYEEGQAKASSDMADAVQQANEITAQSKQLAEAYLVQQERVILDIAIRVAERIMYKALDEDEQHYLAIIERALIEVREMKEIRLYVSPKYYELVSTNKSELDVIFPPDTPFFIFANEELKDAACYIETNHGRIVATIDEQLMQLKEGLIEVLEGDEED